MALITSDRDAMRSPSIKCPESPRIVRPPAAAVSAGRVEIGRRIAVVGGLVDGRVSAATAARAWAGEPWPTAAIHMVNLYCSSELKDGPLLGSAG